MFPLRDDRPTFSPPIVTTLLIIACAMVFLHEISLEPFSRNYFVEKWGMIPARPSLITIVSSMFLHGGWGHIIGNMLFLWAFGKSLEDAMGHSKFLAFYLACGVIAGLTQMAFTSDPRIPTVGASGAIAGVMGAYLLKFPKARIHTLVFVLVFLTTADIPAAFLIVFWFISQVLNGYGTIASTQVSSGGVAYLAHIGGFVAGMILVSVMGTRSRYIRRDFGW